MALITVDPNTSYQTFVGWDVTAQAAHDNNVLTGNYQYPSSTFANYKDGLFAAMRDLGLNSFRVEFNMADVNATGYDESSNNPAIQPSTAAENQWHFERCDNMLEAVVLPYRSYLQAQGEDIRWTLCIVDFRSAGYAAENTPSEYAFLVNKVVTHIHSRFGVRPDLIEAILEPDNASNSNWTATKLANNVVQANSVLNASGHTGIRWMLPNTTSGPACQTWYNNAKSANGSLEPLVEIVGYHRYVNIDNTSLASLRNTVEADGNKLGMTEWYNPSANYLQTIYDDLVTGHNSLWQQYTICYPWSGQTDDGGAYFQVNRATWAVSLGTRTKYLRHFMKYARPGAVMKGVTNGNSNFQGVPFRNANGAYVVPIKCAPGGSYPQTIDVAGLPAGTYAIRYTTGDGTNNPTNYDQALSNQTISAGQNVSFSMPAAGVATVYDVNYLGSPVFPGRAARRTLFR